MNDSTTPPPQASSRGRWLHIGRVLLLVAIVALIHFQHRRRAATPAPPLTLDAAKVVFPAATSIREDNGGTQVLDADGTALGTVFRTSPQCDDIIGFSGPTNVQLVFDANGKLAGTTIVSSEDTRDHVEQIRRDGRFLSSLNGLTQEQIAASQPDAVSGATLTSIAIHQSIVKRLGGIVMPGKFAEPITLADLKPLFEEAASFEESKPTEFHIRNDEGKTLGYAIRTSPSADDEIGYQGPSDVLIALSPDRIVIGIAVVGSFDNEPYVRYVREDWGFPSLFNDLTVQQLAELDLKEAEIEGVSGATMTSMGVARSLIIAAKENLKPPPEPPAANKQSLNLTPRDLGTIAVTIAGLVIGLTSLRGKKRVRVAFQLVLIGYLGLINGDMVSQAMLVGWARSGVPVTTSLGLVALTAAAFALPIFKGQNIYCSHICPHGAVQQLVRNRLPWKVKLSKRVRRGLQLVPGLLLLWVVVVGMGGFAFSLVDVEPFDAWVFRIAGWATITVAIVGLVVSLFVPMAYCRFGCPTGALLEFARSSRGSANVTPRDWLALGCLVVGAAMSFV